MDLTNKIVTFDSKNGKALGKVSTHNTETNILTIHTSILVSTLKPIIFKWGGINIHKDDVQLLNL